ncbi:MAG: nucleotidyltransferase family protein [candidate division NC10 bacterium]|nr:nucleotidyltransferase family protein [candidate division NC10 bacterium]
MRRDEVLKILTEHRDELRQRFAVKSLALFGSVAREEMADASDVDLLVEFERPVGLLHLVGTQQHIEKLLGVERVDLVLRRAVLPELKEDIFAEAVDAF